MRDNDQKKLTQIYTESISKKYIDELSEELLDEKLISNAPRQRSFGAEVFQKTLGALGGQTSQIRNKVMDVYEKTWADFTKQYKNVKKTVKGLGGTNGYLVGYIIQYLDAMQMGAIARSVAKKKNLQTNSEVDRDAAGALIFQTLQDFYKNQLVAGAKTGKTANPITPGYTAPQNLS